MMRASKLTDSMMVLGAALAVVALAGCSSEQIVLRPLPSASTVPVRNVPETRSLTTSARLPPAETTNAELMDEIQAGMNFSARSGESVVISVPLEEQAREQRQRGLQRATLTLDPASDTTITAFRTTGYFNQAESQIERSLLAKGFEMKERAKFEAKLREERSKQRVFQDELTDPEKAEHRALTRERDAGLIPADEYQRRLAELEEKQRRVREAERAEAGRVELVDMAELIRATEKGEDRADYLLQIDAFTIKPSSDQTVDLLAMDAVQNRCAEHAGLREAILASGSADVMKPGFTATLEASLVRVDNGGIVWIGAHRVGSQHVLEDGLTIVLPVTKEVTNGAEVNGAIKAYNAEQQRLLARCRRLRTDLQRRIDHGEFKTTADRDAAIAVYESACRDVETAARDAPVLASAPWAYIYRVGEPQVLPDLPSIDDSDRLRREMSAADTDAERRRVRREYLRYQEFLSQHFKSLAALVSRELIGTIPVDEP